MNGAKPSRRDEVSTESRAVCTVERTACADSVAFASYVENSRAGPTQATRLTVIMVATRRTIAVYPTVL